MSTPTRRVRPWWFRLMEWAMEPLLVALFTSMLTDEWEWGLLAFFVMMIFKSWFEEIMEELRKK